MRMSYSISTWIPICMSDMHGCWTISIAHSRPNIEFRATGKRKPLGKEIRSLAGASWKGTRKQPHMVRVVVFVKVFWGVLKRPCFTFKNIKVFSRLFILLMAEIRRSPPRMMIIPLFIGFLPSQVVSRISAINSTMRNISTNITIIQQTWQWQIFSHGNPHVPMGTTSTNHRTRKRSYSVHCQVYQRIHNIYIYIIFRYI